MLYIFEIEDYSDTNCWKNTCLYRIQNIRRGKINGSTSFAIDNMYYVNFRIKEQESIPWCGEFQNKDQKYLGTLLIFTPIPLTPKKCDLQLAYMIVFKGE